MPIYKRGKSKRQTNLEISSIFSRPWTSYDFSVLTIYRIPSEIIPPLQICWAADKTLGVISVGIGIPAFEIKAPNILPIVPNSSTFKVPKQQKYDY